MNIPEAYTRHLRHDGHQPEGFMYGLTRMLGQTRLAGARVLEIGSGRGLVAAWAGLHGAAHVVSMEPELVGATSGVIEEQRARLAQLGLRNVEVVTADFNTWDDHGARFDVILSRASLNHLYATDQHALYDEEAYVNYVRVASHIHRLLAPGGVFIATDACRYGFFSLARRYGVRRPWNPKRSGVDWRHHQTTGTWRTIFTDAGFPRVDVDYPVPYALRGLAPVVNTALVNFFLKGSFILRAHKGGSSEDPD